MALSSFRNFSIKKRTIISSINYKKYNRDLMISSLVFSIFIWLIYVILSFILIKDAMLTINGLYYILNSFIFTICILTLSLLISTLVINKNALSGIVNVLSLGPSFLCGAFVPIELLPDSVLTFAHIFPSYYFIQNNELLENSLFEMDIFKQNILIMLLFSALFIIINNVISNKRRKIG